MGIRRAMLLVLLTLGAVGCTHSVLTTQRDSLVARDLHTIAFMPIVNATLPPDQTKILAEAMMAKFQGRNPRITFVTPTKVALTLSQTGRLDEYTKAMALYAQTGAIHTESVKALCSDLNVSGLLQGILYGANQNDASFVDWATTKVTFGYSLLSCVDGAVVWSASSESSHKKLWSWDKAPPLYTVMLDAQDAMYAAIPEL
jgi:hypothetical protein